VTAGHPPKPADGTDALPAKELRYILRWTGTSDGTGFFAPRPEGDPDIRTALEWLRHRPMDSFLHRHLLQELVASPAEAIIGLARNEAAGNPVLQALLSEAAYLREDPALEGALAQTGNDEAIRLATPAIYLRHRLLPDRAHHRYWIQQLATNIFEHHPLTGAGDPDAPPLPCAETSAGETTVSIDAVPPVSGHPTNDRPPVAEIIAAAGERLRRLNILASIEMRHEASLSPVALLRQWRLERRVRNGKLHYRLGGFMTAYGRGLTLDVARVSCLMEIVERYSAFGDFSPEAVDGHRQPTPLIKASMKRLRRAGHQFLNPDHLGLEVPWWDAPLHWRPARIVESHGESDIWIPAQCVYLFCNLDEPDLFSAFGSTGLASGSSMAGARLAALLEIVERDAEATTRFDPAACFTIHAETEPLRGLLARYRRLDLHLQFQDLTGPLGIPCYKCFVIAPDGRIAKGTGAHLDGRRALLSALTETMYPYPHGPASRPCRPHLPTRSFESLPDFSSSSATGDLQRLRQLLLANGLPPVFADLTRADLGFPVVRAVVPGMAMMADFDRFSRLNPRQAAALRRAAVPGTSSRETRERTRQSASLQINISGPNGASTLPRGVVGPGLTVP
jgi:ribosomal protein S12 methylthiotransferase accessory factor